MAIKHRLAANSEGGCDCSGESICLFEKILLFVTIAVA